MTEPSSASISIARPCSMSCSIDVLWGPMASAPAMRLSIGRRKRMPNASPTVCASPIIAAASARVGGKRQMSSSVARASALIGLKVRLPQSFVQISVRTSLRTGDLKPAREEELGERRDAGALRAVDFGQRQAMALDMPDDARAFDLRRLIADAGDDGVDRQMAGDHAAGIDALEPMALVRAAVLEEIPPRDAVLGRQHHRLGREDRGDVGRDRRELVRLDPEHDEIGTADVGDAVGRLDPGDDLLAALLEYEAALADRLQVLAARDHADALAGRGEPGRDMAADRPCPDDGDVHRSFCIDPVTLHSTRTAGRAPPGA